MSPYPGVFLILAWSFRYSKVPAGTDGAERTRWKVLADRVVGEKPRIRLSVASVELPDGTVFDQYVMRTARCALLAAAGVSRLRSRPLG